MDTISKTTANRNTWAEIPACFISYFAFAHFKSFNSTESINGRNEDNVVCPLLSTRPNPSHFSAILKSNTFALLSSLASTEPSHQFPLDTNL